MFLTLVLVALAALAGSPSAAGTLRHCGAIRGEGVVPRSIVTHDVRCRLARKVANRVGKVARAPWHGCIVLSGTREDLKRGCVVRRFHCREAGRGAYDALKVRCTRGRQRIDWVMV